MKKFVFVILVVTLSPIASAADYACVQYQREDRTWGEAYKVPYAVVSGSELQQATGDFGKYQSFNNYAIVEWPNGGYSAMQMRSYENDISGFSYSNTTDQNNRTYRIKQAPSFGQCSRY